MNSTRIKNLFAPRQLSAQQAKFNEEDPELHHYTSGRWLWDEEKELAARRIQFSPSALMTVAAKTTGSRTSTNLTKLAEGHFNKAFLIQMNDGQEVVAKLPNPNSGFPFWTTASEVATMDFVRLALSQGPRKLIGIDFERCRDPNTESSVVERSSVIQKCCRLRIHHHGEGQWRAAEQILGPDHIS
jgi:hypothetical protein